MSRAGARTPRGFATHAKTQRREEKKKEGSVMKAIRVHEFGGPEKMRFEEVPDPTPGRGQLVVSLHAAGVNPVDTYIRSGNYANLPELPYTPGMDGAGVVEEVGPELTRFKVGDRVYTGGSITGTYAEKALCHEHQVYSLPVEVDFPQGAGINTPCFTAYYGLFVRTKAGAGETLLVHGATGGVGLSAVQLAASEGLHVIGTGGTPQGRDLVLEKGARHVLDHHSSDYIDEMMALTQGRGVDLILEMLANVNLGKDLTLLAQEGRVVVIGSRGPVEINPRDAMMRNASILGMLPGAAPRELKDRIHAALYEKLKSGALRPYVGREMSLADAPEAHRLILKPGAMGKIILTR